MKKVKRGEMTIDEYKIKLAIAKRKYLLDAAEIKYGLIGRENPRQRVDVNVDKNTHHQRSRITN